VPGLPGTRADPECLHAGDAGASAVRSGLVDPPAGLVVVKDHAWGKLYRLAAQVVEVLDHLAQPPLLLDGLLQQAQTALGDIRQFMNTVQNRYGAGESYHFDTRTREPGDGETLIRRLAELEALRDSLGGLGRQL